MTYTIEQQRWLDMRAAAEANKPNAATMFNNLALTMDGELCIGMTHDTARKTYSCSYIERDGVRYMTSRKWQEDGSSVDGDSDLNLKTIQVGVRAI